MAEWRCIYLPSAVVRPHRGTSLGFGFGRRLELIERNRVLLAAKLFPWSLLLLNAPYYFGRIVTGAWEAARGRGEASLYPGAAGKWTIAIALIRGDFQALVLLPRMLRKRREIDRIRK